MAGKDDLLSSYKLLTSAHDGNLEEVKHIIENRKADINFADVTGKSVLHWACEGGKTDVVNYITRLPNVDLFKESDDLVTPLDISKQHDSALECMKKALVAHAERKVEEYELNMTVSNVRHVSHQSFLNETIARNYNCPYSKTDISTVLSFLCAPSISSQEAAVVEVVEIDLPSMNSKISLYHTKQNETFFTFQARDDMVDRADDEITEALYKVMTIVQILKDKKKSTNVAGKVDLTKQIAEVKAIKLNKSDLQTQRMLLAAIINEMETSRKKIDKYSEFLDRVIRDHADSAAKPALCVIYFVELFACDDTFPEGKNIALAKGERRLLKQLKKDYYKRHYPREQLLNDITCLRTLFVHQNSTSRGLLKPSDMFESAENKEGSYDKEECLQYLQTFTRFVSDSMRNQNFSEAAKIFDKNEDSSFSIKTFSEYIRTRLEKGSKTSDMLSYFCKKSKEFLSSPNEMLHELLFELIVNTGPALRDNYMFSELRNTVVHDFHNETVSGLLRKLPLVTRKLYLHQLASRLAHVLSRMRDEEGNRKLEMELSNQLEELNKSFYELLQPNNSAHMFERGTSHNINAYVKYYLLFLADLLDEEKSNGDNIMELSSKRVITSDQVKLIFERILYLHDIFLRDQSESIPEESLRGDLITQFQISATEADRVVSRIKSEDKDIETDESLEFEKQVNDIIKTLNNLKHPFSVSSHKFSDDDIESLFNVAKLNWNYRELENLLKTYNLTELEKDTVTDVLLKVHMKLVDRKQQFSGEKISRVVSRLLRLIKNMELVDSNLHSLSEAFQNKQLLDYILIELLQPLEVPFKQFVLHKIIRDVSYVDCAAPIVAKVLSEPSSDILIERKALKKFVSIYLKTSDYNSLSNLFLIKSMFRTEALFEEVCEQHLSREQLTEVFKCIDVENVLYFFKCLTNTSESKVVLTVLAAANDYISDLLTLKKFESCQKIIDGASKVEQSLTQCDKSVGFHRCLLRAELLQEQGLSMERNKASTTEVKPFYCKAKKELQRVEENATEHPLQKLLSISKLAYNEYLLCRLAPPRETRTKKKHAKKACRLAETLISNMQQYLSPLPAQSEQEEQSSAKIHTLFSLAENSPKYDSLLKAGKEYEDSLNVSEVYRRFLYYRFAVFDKKTSPEERLALLADYDKLQLLWEQRFSCSEIYLLKRKIPIIQGLDGEYNKLKTLELKIRCFEVAMESLGSFSATAEEAFKFMKESLKTIKEKT